MDSSVYLLDNFTKGIPASLNNRELEQYFLLNDYSDVIDIDVHNCKDLRMDINRDGIITLWSWSSKLKSTFRCSSCMFETCYKEEK